MNRIPKFAPVENVIGFTSQHFLVFVCAAFFANAMYECALNKLMCYLASVVKAHGGRKSKRKCFIIFSPTRFI